MATLRPILLIGHLIGAVLTTTLGCAGPAATYASAAAPSARSDEVDTSPRGLEAALRRSPAVRPFLDDETYRLQVLAAVPTPDGRSFARQGFRVDATYFYPASTVKLCSAVAALELLTELRSDTSSGLDAETPLHIDGGKLATRTSVGAAVDSALVFSDNAAHNVLYDFVGQDGIHERMWRLGLDSTRIRHRLGVDASDDPRETPPAELQVTKVDSVVIPQRTGRVRLGRNEMPGVLVGDEHLSGRSVVAAPMSFDLKNRVSLVDLQELLIAVVRPDLRAAANRPRIGGEERTVLLEALGALPSDRGGNAARDREHKPIRSGVARVIAPRDLVSYSKAGRAYGFVVDNAFFFDKRSGKGFFLAVAVYTNRNGRLDDNDYDYTDVAFPLLAAIGETIAREVLDGNEPSTD